MKTKTLIARFARKAPLAVPMAALLTVSAAHAGTTYWAAVPGTSTDTNWSDTANWTGAQQTYYNQVVFDGVGSTGNQDFSVNNVLDSTAAPGPSQMPIWELDYVPTNSNYTTLINPGVTMKLGAGQGHLMVGADIKTPTTPAPSGSVETITITGAGGALDVGGSLNVGQGSSVDADGHNVTLDLSGLDTYQQSASAFGGSAKSSWLYVAGPSTVYSSTGPIRANGTLNLAKTNEITLGQDFQICNQAYSNSMPCAVYLGQANTIAIGGNLIVAGTGTTMTGAWMKFNSTFLGGANAPTASFTGPGGARIANFWICNGNGGPQVPGYGLCDFSGGSVSMLVDSMQLGQSGDANAEGVLTLDNGVINVNNAIIGNQEVSAGGTGVGIVNLNTNSVYGTNAELIVNDTLTLGAVTGTATAGTAGTINIDGGALIVNTVTNGGGTAIIDVTNGQLTVSGQAGSVAAPLAGVTFDDSSITLPESPSNVDMTVSSLTTGGTTNFINISVAPPSMRYPVQVTLIKYSGAIGGAGFNFGVGTLPAQCQGYISNNTANGSIDLVLTSGPSTESWTGAVNGNWDTTTANWLAGGSAATYANGAFVQFWDGANSGTVNLTTSLSPGGLTVSNNVQVYTFDGSGSLNGSTGLNKQGTNTLIIDNSGLNTFAGGVTIGGGTLQIGNNDANGSLPPGPVTDDGMLVFDQSSQVINSNVISGTGGLIDDGGGTLNVSGANSFSGPVVVTNNSILQLGSASALGLTATNAVITSGSTLDGNGYGAERDLIVSGTGVNGNGVLTDTSTNPIYDSSGGIAPEITLAGDSTFDYPTRWDIGSASGNVVLSTAGNPYNLTLNGSGYFEWKNVAVDPALANIDLQSGTMGIVGSTTFGNPNAVFTLESGAVLVFYGGTPNNVMDKGVDDQGGTVENSGGNNVMTGAMTLESGFDQFQINSGTLTVSNVLSGNGTLYMQGGAGTVIIGGNSPNFSGAIWLYKGGVTLNGLIGGSISSQFGTTLGGSGADEGLVDVSGGFSPGNGSQGGTFNAAGGLTLESSATFTNGLAATTSAQSDLTVVTGNLTVNGNTIYINPFGAGGALQSGGVYPIITYTGTLTGSFVGAQSTVPSSYNFTVTNITSSTGPNEIAVIVTGNPPNLTWNNGSGNGQWDIASSFNWTDTVNQVEDQFQNGDVAMFNDSILNAADPATNVTVSSGVTVLPMSVVDNSSLNYTLSGPGAIGGTATLLKMGTGTLNIAMTNSYTGSTIIGAGTVAITGQLAAGGSPLGTTNGSLVISNGASLVINLTGGYSPGDAGFGAKPITVSGSGVNGAGAIQNVGNALYDDSSTLGLGYNVTLAGNTTIAGYKRLDWGYPGYGMTLSTGGSNYNLTVIEGGYFQWVTFGIDTNLGNIDVYTTNTALEEWGVYGMGGGLGNPTNIITLHSNVEMEVTRSSSYPTPTADDSGYNKVVHVMNGAMYRNAITTGNGGLGDYRDSTSFILDGGSTVYYSNGGGGQNTGTAFSGPVTLNGLVHMEVQSSLLTFSNVISGVGGFYLDNGANQPPLVFVAANTYTGVTDIRTNMNLALIGNGSISQSSEISLSSGATLAVTNRTDGTLTLTSGQALGGRGTIAGILVAGSGSTLAPGETTIATNIGILTVTGNATLAGNAIFKLSNTTNDVLSAGGALAYGGTLTLTNVSATPLAAGQTFKLFKAGSYSGQFSSITPATPGTGLAWNTNNLAVNGTLSIVSTAPPRIASISISGSTLTIISTNGPAGASYVLMESTNLLAPLPWTPVLTNSFNSSGVMDLSTNIINPGTPEEYYILQVNNEY